MEQRQVIEVINEKYDEFFKAEKKVADYILKYPKLVVNANVSEVAHLSGVSDATVIRLCKHLGYQGFYQMKITLSRDIGREDSEVESPVSKENSSFESLFDRYANYMKLAASLNTQEEFEKAISFIKNSSCVYMSAVGNTAILSMYAGFILERMGIHCCYNLQPEYFMNHINLAKEGDCLIAISWSGTSTSVISSMELAKEKGLKIISLTAYKSSPMSRLSDAELISPMYERNLGEVAHSRMGEMMILDILLDMVRRSLKVDLDVDDLEILLSASKL